MPEYIAPSDEAVKEAFKAHFKSTNQYERLARVYSERGKDLEDIFRPYQKGFEEYQVGVAYHMFFNGFHEGYKLSNMERLEQ